MAQTKTKSKPSSKAKPKSRSKAKTRSASKSKPRSRPKPATKSRGGSNAKETRSRSESKAGGSLEKLKGPATVTGAALVAVAGGVAASRSRNGRSGLRPGVSGRKVMKTIKKVNLPKADDAIDWVEEKAKELGDAGYKVAEMSSQARRVKKAASGK